jgi:GNAT superfamily N-acetyltransferase
MDAMAPPVEVVVVRPEDAELLDAVIRLADANRKYLGLMPKGAFVDLSGQARLLAATIGGQLAGYALYDVARGRVRLVHLCVAGGYRRRGVARALLVALTRRHSDLRGVSVKCRRDYPAATIWPTLGFQLMGETVGRGKGREVVDLWWLSHGLPDLFSSSGLDDSEMLVAIDHNVFLDLIRDRPGAGPDESRALESDWLQGLVRLAVTHETRNEIWRLPNQSDRDWQRSKVSRFHELNYRPEDEQQARDRLASAVGDIPEAEASDVRHLISAAAGGARVLVTRDDEFIARYGDVAAETLGLRILRPSDLVAHLDEVASAAKYRPVELQGTDFQVSAYGAEAGQELEEFLNHAAGERRAELRAHLRALAGERQTNGQWVRDPAGRVLAAWATRPLGGGRGLEVPLLRVRADESLGLTVGRLIVRSVKELALEHGSDLVQITDPYLPRQLLPDLADDGFARVEGSATLAAAIIDARTSDEAVTMLHGHPLADRAVAAIDASSLPTQIAALERELWPLKLLDRPLQNYLVPIQPKWAERLLGFRPTLFSRPALLGLSRELVYYRSPRGNPKSPSRIAWYASGTGARRVGAVIAVSRLIDVEVDTPERLHRRNRQLGVWGLGDIRASARGGQASALRFADTELLHRPVSYERLMACARERRVGTLQSPTVIDPQLFGQVYREGTGRG